MDLDDEYSSAIFVILLVAILLCLVLRSEKAEPNLKHIPAAGHQNYLLSYIDAFEFAFRGALKLKEGFNKYKGSTFRLSLLNHWLVILPKEYSEDLRKASEEDVCFANMANQFDPSLDPIGHYEAAAYRNIHQLARYVNQNIAFLIFDLKEEIEFSFENAPVDGFADIGWQETDGVRLAIQLTTQVVNRLFVGLPFARHDELKRVSMELTSDIYQPPLMERLLPRKFISIFRVFPSSNRYQRQMRLLMLSFVRVRKDVLNTAEHTGKYKDYDLLSWALHQDGPQQIPDEIAFDLVNLTITTSRMVSMSLAHVLYHLASNPQYVSPMRMEIESLVRQGGWSKESIDRMHKVDSFVKESMKLKCVYCITTARKCLKPFTFSNGMYLPPGALSAVAVEPRHLGSTYSSPDVFDGFRYSRLHEQHRVDDSPTTDRMNSQFQLVTTTADDLAWGYGRHACPGRFFAATVLKMMLAHVLLRYDVKFENGVRPKDVVVGMNRLPDPSVKMLIKKR
ncbi:cytochrome P450 [Gymnopilus junonius]|uniref:Cytochrome P450 n=1 Tax=Gymnopilus junonius TaxID=109634 RepID=A0A9P5P0J5_GYMJU|nr:cytochrome P450 [Gymnopilus junonius]